MRTKMIIGTTGVAAVGLAAVAIAAPGGHNGSSRLDDGKDLLGQSKITEQQAIRAAKTAAKGGLNEVDLEHRDGRLVWNVDVGKADVKVDAQIGAVVAVDHDD